MLKYILVALNGRQNILSPVPTLPTRKTWPSLQQTVAKAGPQKFCYKLLNFITFQYQKIKINNDVVEVSCISPQPPPPHHQFCILSPLFAVHISDDHPRYYPLFQDIFSSWCRQHLFIIAVTTACPVPPYATIIIELRHHENTLLKKLYKKSPLCVSMHEILFFYLPS